MAVFPRWCRPSVPEWPPRRRPHGPFKTLVNPPSHSRPCPRMRAKRATKDPGPFTTGATRELFAPDFGCRPRRARRGIRGVAHATPQASRDRSPTPACAKSRMRKVPTTGLEPVRRFRHWSLKPACLPIPARGLTKPPCECSGRDSNPHGVNPHRILNPARLPIPPPEPGRGANPRSRSRRMEPRGVEPLTS